MIKNYKSTDNKKKYFKGAVQVCALALLLTVAVGTQESFASDAYSAGSSTSISIFGDFKNLIGKFKEKIFGKKHKNKEPKSIKVSVKSHSLKIKMKDVPKNWNGKIILEDKSGYDSFQENFGYNDMHRHGSSYDYTIKTDDLPDGTYDIIIHGKNDKIIFEEDDVIINKENDATINPQD